MWAKISNSATSMACAACIAAAATLPWTGTAAERIANENIRLSAITDVDAFSAIPAYVALLGGDITALNDLDAWSAINPYLALLGGDITALNDLDAWSAINPYLALLGGDITALNDLDAWSAINPYLALLGGDITALNDLDAWSAINPYLALLGGDITATGDLDSLSAVDTFFGDGPLGADGETPVGGVFTGGGIDALAPNADSGGGYAALSALPVFFGSNAPNTNFGPGVFTGGGLSALSNYDALSAIPAYLNLPPNEAPPLPPPPPAPLAALEETSALRTTSTAALPGGGTGTQSPPSFAPEQARVVEQSAPASTPPTGSNQVQTFVASLPKAFTPPAPQVFTPPAPPKVEAAATPGDNGGPTLNITRTSEKFTPKPIESPILLGGGGQNAGEGMRGYGSLLKKVGLGGGGE